MRCKKSNFIKLYHMYVHMHKQKKIVHLIPQTVTTKTSPIIPCCSKASRVFS